MSREEVTLVYVRFLRLRLRPGTVSEFARIYEERILAKLAETEGCLGAALLLHARLGEAILSLTAWRSAADAAVYDGEGRFARLLNLTEHLLEEGSPGRPDLALDDDLRVDDYDGELLPPATLGTALTPGGFARTASVEIAPELAEEFARRYRAEAALAQDDFPTLRAVLLLRRRGAPTRVVGLSFWRGEEDAARYDLSGRFHKLAADLGDTLSAVSGWRAAFVPDAAAAGKHAEFAVEGWRVPLARTF